MDVTPPGPARLRRFSIRERALWLVLLAAALAFSRAFVSGYVTWDDDRLIVHNIYLASPFGHAMRAFWTTRFESDYLPIPLSSYWLEARLWGLNPTAQHAVDWLLHLVNVGLLYAWLRRLGTARGLTIAATAVFALHPLQTESVMWLSERKGLLSACFLLLGLLARQRARSGGRAWIAAWTALFVLSCLSKATAVLVPFLLLWEARWWEKRGWAEALRVDAWAAAAAVGFSVLRYATYATLFPGLGASTVSGSHWRALPVLIPTAIGHYLLSVLAPVNLAIIYPSFSQTPHASLKLAAGAIFLLAFAWIVAGAGRRVDRQAAFFGAWFLALLLPVLQVVPRANFVNDRYMYLPIVGLVGFVGSLAAGRLRRVPAPVRAICLAAVIAGMAWRTFDRSAVWHDSLALWQDAVPRAPRSQLAWSNLGAAYIERRDPREAERCYLTAIAIVPAQNALPFVNLANLYLSPGYPATYDPARAYDLLQSGLAVAVARDERFHLRYSMAIAQIRLNRRSAAVEILRALLADIQRTADSGSYRVSRA